MYILDIDLDFFLNDIKSFGNERNGRLNSEYYFPWKKKDVINFLEKKCNLSKDEPIEGKIVTNHHEVFYFWRKLIEENILKIPFEIVHIDAHADLGLGDSSWLYIGEEILHKSLQKRMYPKCGGSYLNEGNFLAFAVACRWISEITFITHPEWNNDLNQIHFKDFNNTFDSIGYLQLKKYNPGDFKKTLLFNKLKPIGFEPKILFKKVQCDHFYNDEKKISYIFFSLSPKFTPKESDELIPIISEYIKEIYF